MKKICAVLLLTSVFSFNSNAQATVNVPEYKIITVIESIIQGGLGRSRLLENNQEIDVEALTTERIDGKKTDMGSVKRRDAKIDEFNEAKLLNFYSLTGINFQNIASNDAIISSKLTELAADGWELMFVTSAAEADAGGQDGTGIYITRFIFKR